MFESSQTLYKVNARYFEHVPRTTVEDSYLNAPLHNVYLRVQSDVTDKERVGELGVARIHSNFIEDRNTFLRLPSREEGLNMDRVRTYSQRMGVPYVSIRCLTLTEYQRARAQTIVQLSSVTDADLATYHNALDVITAKRGLEQEILNGPELIESFIVHELAHSTSKYHSLRIDVNTRKRLFQSAKLVSTFSELRQGFGLMQGSDTGSFLEEGYAELERGRYVSEVLEKPSGFSTKPLDIYYGPLYGELLRKYSYKISKGNGEEGIACPIGSLAAATLEILIQEDPALLSAFRKSRHSVEGLREVARRIDAVSPELYQEMRQVYIYNNHGTDQALEVAAKVQDLSNKSRGI